MKRTKHNLSSYKLLTCRMGELVPSNLVEVLPGDSMRLQSSALIRVSPLLAPIMHPVTVRLHHWFVPARLVWSGFEDFITGGADGEGGSAGAYPTVDAGAGFTAGTLPDYMGILPAVASLVVSALPFRAYNLIYNKFYRDQDLTSVVTQDSLVLQNIAWEKDYFTSSRPWPQKGPDVTLPLGVTAGFAGIAGNAPLLGLNGNFGVKTGGDLATDLTRGVQTTGGADIGQDNPLGLSRSSLFSGVSVDLSGATATNVNDVRLAFALQRYQEARARYGSEYVDYLRYLGIRPSDSRLQRPEYLGGGKQTISFSEILQTGVDSADEGVGTIRGHGIVSLRSRGANAFFEEHGFVMTLMSIRPKTMYANSVNRLWSRRTKEDYYQRELEKVGQQIVYRREVYAQADAAGAGGDTEFGWQDRYDDYRFTESGVAGEFRNTLNYWHMARIFSAAPALNSAFVVADPTLRIHAEQTTDTLWCMVNNSVVARRMVGPGGQSNIF